MDIERSQFELLVEMVEKHKRWIKRNSEKLGIDERVVAFGSWRMSAMQRFFISHESLVKAIDWFAPPNGDGLEVRAPFDGCIIETVMPNEGGAGFARLFMLGVRVDDGVVHISTVLSVVGGVYDVALIDARVPANSGSAPTVTTSYARSNAQAVVAAKAVLAILRAINSPRSALSTVLPDIKKNQMLRLRGKKPLSPHHIITLKPEDDSAESAGNAPTGTHASPRQHDRRGHYRTLKSGKTVWVRSCVVGSPDNGVVSKEYRIVR